MTGFALEQFLFTLAPKELAQSWDNVGLLVGDGRRDASHILVALDITQSVAEEAISLGCDAIVAHHPVMNCAWHKVQTLRPDDPQGKLLTTLIQKNITAICMHTNLDSAENGVNDALAKALSLTNMERLSEDGLGRIGTLPEPMEPSAFAAFVKERLYAPCLRYADGGKLVQKVAVGGGACGEFAGLAHHLGCDAFVTADLKYHDFQNAAPMGLTMVDAGHFPTENVIVAPLAKAITKAFPEASVTISQHKDVILSI